MTTFTYGYLLNYYRSRNTVTSDNQVVPAFLWDAPQIKVSYQPPKPPYGRGFPGTLTVTGQNFSPNTDLLLTITNCGGGGLPCRTSVHTTQSYFYCPHYPQCRYYIGGEFYTTIPIYCGGDTTVTAQDGTGNELAIGATSLPC